MAARLSGGSDGNSEETTRMGEGQEVIGAGQEDEKQREWQRLARVDRGDEPDVEWVDRFEHAGPRNLVDV